MFASGIHVYTMSVYDPGGHYRQKLPLLTVICVWQRAEAKIFNDVLKRPNFDFDIFGYLYSLARCEHRPDGQNDSVPNLITKTHEILPLPLFSLKITVFQD